MPPFFATSCSPIIVRRMPAAALDSYDYSHLIGGDFTVSDADNSTFAAYLPRTGTAVRQIALEEWGSDWLVLQLHKPFDYQLGSLDTGFRGVRITQFILRSRLVGQPIGSEWTSVFVLLDPDHLLDTKLHFRSTDFIHVTWAMIRPNTPNQSLQPTAGRSDV
jgi:hypothetical protein